MINLKPSNWTQITYQILNPVWVGNDLTSNSNHTPYKDCRNFEKMKCSWCSSQVCKMSPKWPRIRLKTIALQQTEFESDLTSNPTHYYSDSLGDSDVEWVGFGVSRIWSESDLEWVGFGVSALLSKQSSCRKLFAWIIKLVATRKSAKSAQKRHSEQWYLNYATSPSLPPCTQYRYQSRSIRSCCWQYGWACRAGKPFSTLETSWVTGGGSISKNHDLISGHGNTIIYYKICSTTI